MKCVLHVKNQRGLTLIELMVGVGLGLLVMTGAGFIFTFAMDSFNRLVDQNEAEESLLTAAYALRTVATQGVEVFGVSSIVSGFASGGQILNTVLDPQDSNTDYNSVTSAAIAGTVEDLAAFYREAGQVGVPLANANGASDFRPTGIFFRKPAATCVGTSLNVLESCSGALIIDIGAISGNSVDGTTTTTKLIYNRFVAAKLVTNNISSTDGDRAKEARFSLTVRYFLQGKSSAYNYLPFTAEFAESANVAPADLRYRDRTMEVFIGFRNNYLGPSQLQPGQPERLHGSLYYFPFNAPKIRGL